MSSLVDVPDRLACDHCGALYFPTSQTEQCPHRSIFLLKLRARIRKAVRK